MEKAAEAWGAEWSRSGGRLVMPVTAGLRDGRLAGRLWVEPAAAGSAVVLRVEERTDRLRTRAVALLVLAAAGGLIGMLWPFFPALLPFLPLALVLVVGAWFLVISRLTTSGPEELLELVRELAAAGDDEE